MTDFFRLNLAGAYNPEMLLFIFLAENLIVEQENLVRNKYYRTFAVVIRKSN
jgi:hypothetical protein